MQQLSGIFSELSLGATQPNRTVPQATAYDVENILALCRELMVARAQGELEGEQHHNAVEQLRVLRDQVKQAKVQLTGNACRDLLGNRRVHLDDGKRLKAVRRFLGLLEATLVDLESTPILI